MQEEKKKISLKCVFRSLSHNPCLQLPSLKSHCFHETNWSVSFPLTYMSFWVFIFHSNMSFVSFDFCLSLSFFCHPVWHKKKKICHPKSFNIFVLLAFMLWVSILSSLKVLVAQSRLTLCDPMDCSPPGSSVHEILQARILEWVAISYSNFMVYLLLEIRLDYEYYSRSVHSIFM